MSDFPASSPINLDFTDEEMQNNDDEDLSLATLTDGLLDMEVELMQFLRPPPPLEMLAYEVPLPIESIEPDEDSTPSTLEELVAVTLAPEVVVKSEGQVSAPLLPATGTDSQNQALQGITNDHLYAFPLESATLTHTLAPLALDAADIFRSVSETSSNVFSDHFFSQITSSGQEIEMDLFAELGSLTEVGSDFDIVQYLNGAETGQDSNGRKRALEAAAGDQRKKKRAELEVQNSSSAPPPPPPPPAAVQLVAPAPCRQRNRIVEMSSPVPIRRRNRRGEGRRARDRDAQNRAVRQTRERHAATRRREEDELLQLRQQVADLDSDIQRLDPTHVRSFYVPIPIPAELQDRTHAVRQRLPAAASEAQRRARERQNERASQARRYGRQCIARRNREQELQFLRVLVAQLLEKLRELMERVSLMRFD